MKSVVIPLSVLLLAGCDIPQKAPAAIKVAKPGRDLERWGPDEFGVVCYRRKGMGGISCVKVQPPVQHTEAQR